MDKEVLSVQSKVGVLAALVLALLIVFPVSHHEVKIPVVLAVAGLVVVQKLVRPSMLAYPIFWMCALWSWAVLGFWCLWSLILGNPGAREQLLIYVALPISITIALSPLLSKSNWQYVKRAMTVSATTLVVLHISFLIPSSSSHELMVVRYVLGPDAELVVHEGYSQFRSIALSSFVFLLPYYFCRVLISIVTSRVRLGDVMLLASILVVVALGGRRAILLSTVIVSILTLGGLIAFGWFHRDFRLLRRSLFLVVLGFTATTSLSLLNLGADVGFYHFFMNAFRESNEEGALERFGQMRVLWNGFAESPLFGHGPGAVADAWVRSELKPWQYELQYSLYLYQFGLIGCGLLLIPLVAYSTRACRLMIHSTDALVELTPWIGGFVGLLVSNGTNPYLQAYGHFWMFLLPIFAVELNWTQLRVRSLVLGKTEGVRFASK
jgi:hypothetical protein